MKYIIMCGGHYEEWQTPKHMVEIKGEPIAARTIRLLRECGVKDIAISTHDDRFKRFGVPLLKHENDYYDKAYNNITGHWCNCFYPMDEPVCYLFGDVVFSPQAIKTIVDYEVEDIMLFGSKPPFAPEYPKKWIEPFAYKVKDTSRLKNACDEVKALDKLGVYKRKPIAWELWSAICGSPPNYIDKSYVAINDYTCDIDEEQDIAVMERVL